MVSQTESDFSMPEGKLNNPQDLLSPLLDNFVIKNSF